MRIMYLISSIILWICIVANIYNLISLRRLSKDHQHAIDSTYEAWKKYLIAEQNYLSMAAELRAEKEQLRTLHESEEDVNET